MKPIEALDAAMHMVHFSLAGAYGSSRNKPGEVIKLLNLETREALSKLTSEDFNNWRIDLDHLSSPEREAKEAFSKELMEFDKRFKK